ncbi:MAG TPA: hypothetical protein VD793_02565, partial [Gemmatimonadales bacterium]|nr:hypothetical protein [Gemmatimonadales bacterium]
GLRVRDQVVTVEQSSQDGRPLVVEQGPASIRLRASGAAAVRVRYRLTGSLGRVPVFVPSIPTRPPGRTVRIVVSGLEAHRVTRFTVPRFRSDGSRWVAELEHVPSLVAVIRDQSDRPVPLVAELVVLLVAVGGTGYWLARLARTRPSHAGARA